MEILRSLSVYTGSVGVGVGCLLTLGICLGLLSWCYIPVISHLGRSSLKTSHSISFWIYCPTPKDNWIYPSSLWETVWITVVFQRSIFLILWIEGYMKCQTYLCPEFSLASLGYRSFISSSIFVDTVNELFLLGNSLLQQVILLVSTTCVVC